MIVKRTWEDALTLMQTRINATADQVKEGFPHYADTTSGQWTTSPDADWTGGYWNGMLWLAAANSEDDTHRELAERWTQALRPRITSETGERGFLFYFGSAIGAILSGNNLARQVAISGAQELATLYNSTARIIPVAQAKEEYSVGRDQATIDCMVGTTALLSWASTETGDAELHEIAKQDALRHIEFCVRADGSISQSASFDLTTGELQQNYNHKGLTDDSTWARAQAWAIVGYAMSTQWIPEQPEFLDTAQRVADWWIENVPEDYVAYWDFDAPYDSDTKRDTAATAITASGMLRLSTVVHDEELSGHYRKAAENTVRSLVNSYLTPTENGDTRPAGMLTHGCYNNLIGLAPENELIWGSYHLYESLNILVDNIHPDRI